MGAERTEATAARDVSTRAKPQVSSPLDSLATTAVVQRMAGNLGIQRSLRAGPIQRKCACGALVDGPQSCSSCAEKERLGLQAKLNARGPTDAYEHEADRVADHVMSASSPTSSGHKRHPQSVQRLSSAADALSSVAPPSVEQTLSGQGVPLEGSVRQDMEQRFGHGFGHVRLHTDAGAHQSAQVLSARAYTLGSDIVFGRGEYAPETSAGKSLLAHELTHVLQQGGEKSGAVQRDSTDDLAAGIARDLQTFVASNPAPVSYRHVIEIVQTVNKNVEDDIDDNVSSAFTELQTDTDLDRYAEDADGRRMLDVLS